MAPTHDDEGSVMGRTGRASSYPATSDEMPAALNTALETGNLNRIMGILRD